MGYPRVGPALRVYRGTWVERNPTVKGLHPRDGFVYMRQPKQAGARRDEGAYCDEIRDRGATKPPPVLASR